MPRLANERHELYALHRAKGFSPSKAGIAAGFASGSSTVSELEKSPEVMARVDELIAEIAERREGQKIAAREAAQIVGQMTGYSKAWVIEKLAEVAQLAAGDGDYKAANESLKLIGDEFGMFKGASGSSDDEGNLPKAYDLDALTTLMNDPKPASPPAVTGRDDPVMPGDGAQRVGSFQEAPRKEPFVPSQAALDLIEGQGRTAKRQRLERQGLPTGSETDVAMTPAAEPVAVDDILAHFEQEADRLTEAPEEDLDEQYREAAANPTVVSDDDDTPPRRSRVKS